MNNQPVKIAAPPVLVSEEVRDVVVAKIHGAIQALVEARSIQETINVIDSITAARIVYGKRRDASKEVIAEARRIEIYAEAKLGALIEQGKEAGEILKPGDSKIDVSHGCIIPTGNNTKKSLADLGIKPKLAMRAQQLARLPEKQLEEVASGRVKLANIRKSNRQPTKPVERRHPVVPGMSRIDDRKREIYEWIDALGDGEPHPMAEIFKITGLSDVRSVEKNFLLRVALVPWLTLRQTEAGTVFLVDGELRDICEGRMPRPSLSGESIQTFLRRLRDEIVRRRKEAHDVRLRGRWSPDAVVKLEQTKLLDWIEDQLAQLPEY